VAFKTRRLKLIAEWKRSWRFASVWFSSAGLFLMGALEFLGHVFNSLPESVQSKIPHASTVAMVFFALTIIGRLFKWVNKDDDEQQEKG
jgi:hypothetical protein